MKPITVSSILPEIVVTPGSLTITMSPAEALLFHSLLGRINGADYRGWLALQKGLVEHGGSDTLYEKAAELIGDSYTKKSTGIPLADLVQAMECNLRNRRQGVFA